MNPLASFLALLAIFVVASAAITQTHNSLVPTKDGDFAFCLSSVLVPVSSEYTATLHLVFAEPIDKMTLLFPTADFEAEAVNVYIPNLMEMDVPLVSSGANVLPWDAVAYKTTSIVAGVVRAPAQLLSISATFNSEEFERVPGAAQLECEAPVDLQFPAEHFDVETIEEEDAILPFPEDNDMAERNSAMIRRLLLLFLGVLLSFAIASFALIGVLVLRKLRGSNDQVDEEVEEEEDQKTTEGYAYAHQYPGEFDMMIKQQQQPQQQTWYALPQPVLNANGGYFAMNGQFVQLQPQQLFLDGSK